MKSYTIITVVLVYIVLAQIPSGNSGKILFVLPIASKSHHHNVFEPLVLELAKRNHDIVLMSPYKPSELPPNVESIIATTPEQIFGKFPDPFELRKQSKLAMLFNSTDLFDEPCHAIFQNERVQKLLKEESFDLVVFDIYMDLCVAGMLSRIGAPYIYLTTMAGINAITESTGTHQPPSFVPSSFLQYSDRMDFLERCGNTVFQWLFTMYGKYVYYPGFEKIYRKYLGENTPSIKEINANVNMIFMNSHFAMTYPRPLLPDIVEVGGMHCRPSQALPKDLDDFISGAEHGLILFSLGSIAKGNTMPEENRQVFVKVFAKLKQRVLWKWETETMEGLPSNVMLKKFLPQQDILGHPKIRLFMTHGGLLSGQESLYHGVPLITIPLFGDQDLNAQKAEAAGYSLTLEILGMTEEVLENTINRILHEPKFAQRSRQLSAIIRDQPEKPLDRAVFWSEYVIRHKGAVHMRSAARDLNMFQFHSLDVIATLLVGLFTVLFASYVIVKKIIRKIFTTVCPRNENTKTKREKKLN